jgi:hypothetical protein
LTSVCSGVTSSNCTVTGIPTFTRSGAATTFARHPRPLLQLDDRQHVRLIGERALHARRTTV